MSYQFQTINIKGKDYVTVNERIKYFNQTYPNGYIETEIIDHKPGLVLMRTTVVPDAKNPARAFTGFAQEKENEGMVNKTSYIENCETSAVGRALAMLGIGVDTSMASAEEVDNAIAQQEYLTKNVSKKTIETIEKGIKAIGKDKFDELCLWNSIDDYKKVKEEKALELLRQMKELHIKEKNEDNKQEAS